MRLFLFLFFVASPNIILSQENGRQDKFLTPLTPRKKIVVPDFRKWEVLKSEKIEHPKNKTLTALIQKLENQDGNEWIVTAKITNSVTGDSWQRAFFLRTQSKLNDLGIKMLDVYDIFLNSGEWKSEWFVDTSLVAIGDKDSNFYTLIDFIYKELVDGLKNLPEKDNSLEIV